jgi:hypothetical protein
MKKATVVMAGVVLLTLMSSFANAADFCYQLSPFVDVLKLSQTNVGTHKLLFGDWVASGSYALPSVGAKELDVNGVPRRIGIHATNNSADFGGNMDCVLDGIANQPWALQCSGNAAGPFSITGDSLKVISCSTFAQSAGPAAGKSK